MYRFDQLEHKVRLALIRFKGKENIVPSNGLLDLLLKELCIFNINLALNLLVLAFTVVLLILKLIVAWLIYKFVGHSIFFKCYLDWLLSVAATWFFRKNTLILVIFLVFSKVKFLLISLLFSHYNFR